MAAKGTKNRKVEETEAKAVLAYADKLNLPTVIAQVGELQVQVQNSLAGLSAEMSSRVQQLDQLKTAIQLKEQRLQELFGIEKEAVTLDEVKAQAEEERKRAEAARHERERLWAEDEADRSKRWQRQEEEFNYGFTQQKKKATDELNLQITQAKQAEVYRKQDLEAAWAKREAALKAQEAEVAELRTQVAGLDNRVKAEVAKAEAIVGASLKKHYESEAALLRKDLENQQKLFNAEKEALQNTVKDLQRQVEDLKSQLTAARADAKDVATQALQSASGRQVADALQRVVDTRETPTKSK